MLGIGLPVRNGEKTLGPTLESLREQTFSDFEVVVVDNASTDATEEIVRTVAAADHRFRYVRHDRNIGILANYNAAFTLGRGDLHMWAANDLYDPRYLERCVALLADRPDAVAASTRAEIIDAAGVRIGPRHEAIRWDEPDQLDRFAGFASYRHHCLACYAVMRRAAVAKTRLMLPFWGSDRLFLAELALQGPMLLAPEVLFFNRSHHDFKADHRNPPASYLLGLDRPRALTVHYGRELARSLARFGIEPRRRRRVMARWAWENRRWLSRSALRGLYEAARSPGRPSRPGSA